jgi:hypothetical protein
MNGARVEQSSHQAGRALAAGVRHAWIGMDRILDPRQTEALPTNDNAGRQQPGAHSTEGHTIGFEQRMGFARAVLMATGHAPHALRRSPDSMNPAKKFAPLYARADRHLPQKWLELRAFR